MPRQRGDRDGGNRIRPKMLSDAAQRNPGDAERGGMECANTPDSTRVATVDSSTLKQQLNPPAVGVEKLAGKARRRVMPRHGEKEQRGQTASPPRQRAGSGLTHMVSVIGADNIRLHETSRGLNSGQLLLQGSSI